MSDYWRINTDSSQEKHCESCGELIPPPNACIAVGREAIGSLWGEYRSIVVCSEECQQAYEVVQHVRGQDLTAAISALASKMMQSNFQPHTIIASEDIAKKFGILIKVK